ncbi:HAD-IIB family hydrolase [Marinactinospora thermotolerans]|uniref:AAA+ ATPase domain-containing protein n=1 Tax=Marinactinospora thermotolerans DSM 45154 TaxID=1122192 RepID=A0A1T4NDU3_9ACTN|nr:HAD-IIB family hydrolase [Marinactinospora thermotolerans]SJZ77226.1 hypothetical protein SAMN02745673_01395 [Marinactinospora thermotolerans DSM 45154]
MRYHALACDFDGTIAERGEVDEETMAALERVSRSGRRLLLVTGRELDDLLDVFPHADLFDAIVAENGGVLYEPGRRAVHDLAEAAPPELVDRLRAAGVEPLGVGRVLIATREPHDRTALEAIRELGLELQLIHNKGAVMVLPPGVNKATGLRAALERLRVSPHNVVAVGDAENDHAMLAACECGAAVANALDALKHRCDLVLERPAGAGVADLARDLVDGDLADVAMSRHDVLLGTSQGEPVTIPPYGSVVAVAGPSGSGKSTTTSALLERLGEAGYQYCVIDPEGDYTDFDGATVLGDPTRAPLADEVLRLLEDPGHSAVVNLLAVPLRDRPAFFADLLPRLAGLRSRLGHPHWTVVDEAHHLMPTELADLPVSDLRDFGGLMMITVHPETLARRALEQVDTVIGVGADPSQTLRAFADVRGCPVPRLHGDEEPDATSSLITLWRTGEDKAVRVRLTPGEADRSRHIRKYAAGTMSPDKSFYFTGPEERLHLRARNLHTFLELAEGVDDETWTHHLRRNDYSRWMAEAVRDDELADAVREVEEDAELDPRESRERIAAAVDERYTLPAEPTRYDPDHDDDTATPLSHG